MLCGIGREGGGICRFCRESLLDRSVARKTTVRVGSQSPSAENEPSRMSFSGWNKWALVSAVALGLLAVSQRNVACQQNSPAGSTAMASAMTPEFKADRSVEQLAQLNCPSGIEHFLPGSYYYCVGVRDVARGENNQARSMLQIAAGWGSKPAEFLLGVGYYKGDLQPRDRARGLAWLGLASERDDPTYLAVFASAWKQVTPQERASAQQLWRLMLPTYGDRHAAHRAELRYRHEREALVRNAVYGATVCIAGLNARQVFSAQPGNDDSLCKATQPVDLAAKRLDVYAEQLFDGWAGHVTVGELKPLPVLSK
ncbi:MAG: hypothetical protein ABI767_07800 [Rhodanobacter sp.]